MQASKEEVIQLLQSSAETTNIFQPFVTEAELSDLADEIIRLYTISQPPTPSTSKTLKGGFLI